MVHLGKPTTIAESYKKVKPIFFRILRLLLLIVVFTVGPFVLIYGLMIGALFATAMMVKSGSHTGAMVGLGIIAILGAIALLGSVVWMFYCLCRYALAVPASTLENLPAGKSLRRSRLLADGAKWSICGIVLLTFILSFVVAYALQIPALIASGSAFITATSHLTTTITTWIYIANFIGATVTGPITTIALVLVYYNQRVRKEAFDLQILMEAVGEQNQMQAAAVAASSVPPAIG
jgi:hypothetical protein